MNGFRKDVTPRKKRNSGGSLGQKLMIEGTANLNNFVYNWNRRHAELMFALTDGTMIGRPVRIAVRFSRSKFMELCDAVNFERFCKYIDIHSHQTLFVIDDERLFENGLSISKWQHSQVTTVMIRCMEFWTGLVRNSSQ